jgi:hypothetical protein
MAPSPDISKAVSPSTDKEFLMEFPCKGTNTPKKDKDGEYVCQLWRIWNKCTLDGVDCYEIQYFEDNGSQNLIWCMKEDEIKSSYSKHANAWEAKFKDGWQKKYGTNGRAWSPDDSKAAPTPKRLFDDTPSKDKGSSGKKRALAGRDDEHGSDEEGGGALIDADPFGVSQPSGPANAPLEPLLSTVSNLSIHQTPSDRELQGPAQSSTSSTTQLQIRGKPTNQGTPSRAQDHTFKKPALPINTGKFAIPASKSPRFHRASSSSSVTDPQSPQRTAYAQMRSTSPVPQLTVSTGSGGPDSADDSPRGPPLSQQSRSPLPSISGDEEDINDDQARVDFDVYAFSQMSAEEELTAAYQESQLELQELFDNPDKIAEARPGLYADDSEALIRAYEDFSVECLLTTAMDLRGMPCDRWVEKRKLDGNRYEHLLGSLWQMLLSWDPLVLRHFVRGNLPEAEELDNDLKKTLRKLKNIPKDEARPSIYAQYLADKGTGDAPTAKICTEILDIVELYARGFECQDTESADIAAAIDTAFSGGGFGNHTAKKGQRRYLEKSSRRDICLEWVHNTRKQLEGLAANEPLPRPWCEIGYATYPYNRLEEHKKHQSSNYLMNLTDAICRYRFDRFVIHQYVVFHISHVTHAMFAEILASRIGLAYTTHGGGWCHFVAGVSHAKVHTMKPEYWRMAQEELDNDEDYQLRMNVDLKDMEKRTQLYKDFASNAREMEEHIEFFQTVIDAGKRIEALKTKRYEQALEEREAMDPIVKFMEFMSK